ncbi:MAG: hypothetical protein P0S96_00540 [Simkaniaceae bacterium]|nr:hypothetical protein [Candidatus Sacchlamyda saccharinae]
MKKWLLLPLVLITLYFTSKENLDLFSEIPRGSEETASIATLLEQKFTYLGQGSQIIAFASTDGDHVLKVFKARHEKPFKFSRYLRSLCTKDKEQSTQKWTYKFQDTIRRYKMAFVYLKEETGLIYLHFQKTPIPLPITLKGKKLDLSQYPFIIQKRAMLAPEYIKDHPEGVLQLKKFFKTRLEKGFSDPRQTLSTNYGFIGNKPIQIDPGKLEPFEGDPKEEIQKIHDRVDQWSLNLF